MAAVASAADQTSDLLQKLSIESKNKTHEGHEVTKKPSSIQYGSVNGIEAPKFQMPTSERSLTPVLPEYSDPNICYVPNGYSSTAYYYGGYDGSMSEWDYSRYSEGVEVPHGVYGDMYGYGYAPYGAYHTSGSPVPSLGHDTQMYGAQHYQYPSPYFQPQTAMNGAYSSNNTAPRTDVNSATITDKPSISVDSVKSNSTVASNGSTHGSNDSTLPKQNQQNSLLNSNNTYSRGALVGGHPSSGYQDSRYSFDGMRTPVSWYDGSAFSDPYARSTATNVIPSTAPHNTNFDSSRNQNVRTVPQLMGYHTPRPTPGIGPQTHGIMNRMYATNRMYEQCGNAYRPGIGFGSNFYDPRRWGMFVDGKYKPRGRGNGFYGYGNENLDGLSELNRGPRANRFKNYKSSGTANESTEDSSTFADREQYNKTDFSEKYSDAKFFVIKSYSEDDIHKSIKYAVWASTPNGNKKLDGAYKDAQGKAECPVFLFFSVNTSGQFVGVAEMVGPVDFNKTVEYWQQDKWNGCFSVKWHIVKDVPNNILKHITIENNDNKPVTNSRDTQEVKLEQGLQMLKIFKEHSSKTSILDDFGFYEARQKVMQEKRCKQQQLSRPMVEIKPAISVDDKGKDGLSVNPGLQKPLQPVIVMKKEGNSVCLGERKQSADNSLASDAVTSPKGARTVPEKRIISNGSVNGAGNSN